MSSSPNRRAPRRLLQALGIADEERRIALWTALLFLVTQSTHGLGANAADTLFFLRFGVDQLPRMIAVAGVVVMAVVLAHTVGLTSMGDRRWLPLLTGASAGWVLLSWLGVFLDRPEIYPIIWVSTQAIVMVTFTMMWNAAGAVCTTRQAKRLFPLFATAGVFGGIVGNLATGPIAAVFGTQSLLLAQASLLALSTILVFRIGVFMRADAPEDAAATSVVVQFRSAIRSMRDSRLLRLAAGVAFTTWILFYLVVFPFSEAVAAAFADEAGVASFLGVFSSVATAITFIVGLVLAKRVFARFGIVVSLLILPLVYAAGFLTWIWQFNLTTAALVRGAQWVALNALGATAFTALFNVLTGKRRAQVVAFMTAVPAQLGTIAGGLSLLATRGGSGRSLFLVGLGISIVAVGLVVAMRPAYLEAVVDAVRKGLVGMFSIPGTGLISPEDGDAIRILRSHLEDDSPETRAFALSALGKISGPGDIEDAASYLDDQSPLVRMAAFDMMCDWDPEGFRSHARIALSDDSPDVRVRALHYAASHGALDIVRDALSDGNTRVRAAAAAIVGGDEGRSVALGLIESGDASAKRALLAEEMSQELDVDMSSLLDDPDAEVRALAVKRVAGTIDPNRLLPLLDDRSLRVRRAAAGVLASTREGRALLDETLQTGTVNETDAALKAMVPFREFSDSFAGWARREAVRAADLNRLARGIGGSDASDVRTYLRRVLEARAARLEQWVLMAMTTIDTAEVMPLVQRGVVSKDAETRAQAIEALETVGDRKVLEVLLPLLDEPAGGDAVDQSLALRELAADFDPWLRGLAMRCLEEMIETDLNRLVEAARDDESALVREIVPSLTTMPVEKPDALGLMDRVLALQRVPMFSRLDPEDLEVVAGSTREVFFEPDEVIYREGEHGEEALMIVEGSAEVTVTRAGESRMVATYVAGDSVGELALLRSGRRSADVTAGPAGLHGVVMAKGDFVSILEERPSVALGMLSTLADRIVEET